MLNLPALIHRHPLIVTPATAVMDAIAMMSHSQLPTPDGPSPPPGPSPNSPPHVVLVVANQQVVGVLTALDVVRLVASQQPLESLVMRQVMSSQVATWRETDLTDQTRVFDLLRQSPTQALIILDERERLVGVLSCESVRTALMECQAAIESQLHVNEQRYAALAAATPVGIVRADPQGLWVYLNDRGCQMAGLTLETALQSGWQQAIYALDRAVVLAEWAAAVRRKGSLQIEFRFQHRDGTVVWVYGQVVPVWSDTGELTGYIGTITDISDRKFVEQQLQLLNQDLEAKVAERSAALLERDARLHQSETQLQAILNFATAVIYVKTLAGEYTLVNQAFLNLFECTTAEIVGKTDHQFFPLETADLLRANDVLLMAEGTVQQFEEPVWVRGVCRTFLSSKFLLRDSAHHPYAICGMSTDITDRKSAEQIICQKVAQEQLLWEITQRIRQSLDLQTIFQTACAEIRRSLQADRVSIFKFTPGSNFNSGRFVSEAVGMDCSPILNRQVDDHCFGDNYATLYAQGHCLVIEDIYTENLTTCHREILAQFEIRANLVLPLLSGQSLWGLLCVHQCHAPRSWQQAEIDLTQQLAYQLAIAIQQAHLYEQIQAELLVRQQAEARIALQLRRQQAMEAIVQQIRESLDLAEILATVTQQVKAVLHCDRVIVFQLFPNGTSQIVEEAVSPDLPSLKARQWEDETWSQDILDCYWQGQPRIVPDVMQDIWTDCLREYSQEGQIQSKIVAPILQEVLYGEFHRWVAPQQEHKLWGILVVHACQSKRLWQQPEAELLQHIANQLSIAIHQANLFAQLQLELRERKQAEQQLTERNQQLALSNEELARATRMKDEFLANMSHELRTPLNAILGMTESLQEAVFGPTTAKQNKALQTIERSGSHLLELINDILDVAKIEAGQIELDCASTAIAPLCHSSLAFIKQQAYKKQLQLEIQLPPQLPDLLIDERRIRQVLINLLNNAVKFTPERGTITLRAYCCQLVSELDPTQEKYLQISVIDTGIGIAPDHINRLFKPFIQIDSALNRQYQGTGLGLVLVKRIVELHQGFVSLTSEVGVGSCFTISLPCDVNLPNHCFNAPFQSAHPNSPIQTVEVVPIILLVEDNEANIATISSYLAARGFQVQVAKTGEAAIASVVATPPDLILMDLQMPGMDGLEAIHHIRGTPSGATLPIIALTALAMSSDRDRCLAAGASDYLSKPVKLKELVTLIQHHLAHQ